MIQRNRGWSPPTTHPGPYTRLDNHELPDPSQRPTSWDYDRYLWLVQLLRKYRYDDAEIHRKYPFQIKDVFFSAVLVAANAALLDLAEVAGATDADRALLATWLKRGRAGLAGRFDAGTGLCDDYDVRAGEDIKLGTFAGFAPLFAGVAEEGADGVADGRAAQLRLLDSADFRGNPRFRWKLLPSTSPAERAFEPRNYWRGPVWPVINWLLWRGLRQLGDAARADDIRRESLGQIAGSGAFSEYFEPFTGHALGSQQQSWTAAVTTLDWLAGSLPAFLRVRLTGSEQRCPHGRECSTAAACRISPASLLWIDSCQHRRDLRLQRRWRSSTAIRRDQRDRAAPLLAEAAGESPGMTRWPSPCWAYPAREPITLSNSLTRLGKIPTYCVWKERLDRPIW